LGSDNAAHIVPAKTAPRRDGYRALACRVVVLDREEPPQIDDSEFFAALNVRLTDRL
jgi:hypothetical protein